MGLLFWSVRTQELRTEQWSSAPATHRRQKQVFMKSMLCIGAFVVVGIPTNIVYGFDQKHIRCVWSFFIPLQGVLNVLIYADLFASLSTCVSSIGRSIKNFFRVSAWEKERGSLSEHSNGTANLDSNDGHWNNNATEP